MTSGPDSRIDVQNYDMVWTAAEVKREDPKEIRELIPICTSTNEFT